MTETTRSVFHPARVRARLRELLAERGLTKTEVVARMGGKASKQHLGQVLWGERLNPGIVTVGAILEAMGCTWADLDAAEKSEDSV